ncbi:hypothetical protein TNCV_949711 [Trichonephila clavipes]|nr:hypothetical protein TNCV_949711 [Trichonephila clavipes]
MYDDSESLGIRRFLDKINDVANLGKWSNDEKVTILKLKLAGIAEDIFLSDPTHSQFTEYNDIAGILIKRSEKAVSLSTRLQLFSLCIQGSSESVQEFAARINKLGTQIFQSGNSAQSTAVRNANDQLLQTVYLDSTVCPRRAAKFMDWLTCFDIGTALTRIKSCSIRHFSHHREIRTHIESVIPVMQQSSGIRYTVFDTLAPPLISYSLDLHCNKG